MRGGARLLIAALLAACVQAPPRPAAAPVAGGVSAPEAVPAAEAEALLDDVEQRTFHYFWDLADPHTRLIPDRWPSKSFSSVAAVGFGLTAYPIGADRGWITREQARQRVLQTLRFLAAAPQGEAAHGMTGYRGFFYHFLDMGSGERFQDVELSTVDSALLFAGVLFCESYFDRDDPGEAEIRRLADGLYRRADWSWVQPRPPRVGMGWYPERGFHDYDWSGYDEAMIVYLLALGSPTHPVDPAGWTAWTGTYKWGTLYEQAFVQFAPLFGHQYSHVWIDFRGIRDPYIAGHGIDYFENSRRATYAQRAYAVADPMGWKGYGPEVWGLTACDGPADVTLAVGGTQRAFHTYTARGVAAGDVRDDGTLAPTAAVSSLPFAPEIVLPALRALRERYGERLYSTYGFRDAFNPTFTFAGVEVERGEVDRELGWFDSDYLGIDQGPIVAMIENYRTGLVWATMRKNPYVVAGLRRAGFTGGWLDEAPR
jgi:hypothetical protein